MKQKGGFTIVELLVVVIVIAILAAIVIAAFTGAQNQARMSKINVDLRNIRSAVMAARDAQQKTFIGVTGDRSYGNGGAEVPCAFKPNGTDLAALPRTDNCWVAYLNALDVISTASSINVRNIVDPWGRPYMFYEGENGPPGECNIDSIAAFALPLNGFNTMPNTSQSIPLSRFTGC